MTTLTVQGQIVTPRLIAAFAKRIDSLDVTLSVWANAACLQAAQHGNTNWLRSMFDLQALRLKSGELSKAGKDVLSYITAHYPAVKWDKENKKVAWINPKGDSVLAEHFVHPTATEESEGVIAFRNKFYTKHGDFALTFSDFKNIEKESKVKDDAEPSMNAKAFIKQAEKALEMVSAKRFVGTSDELATAVARVKSLFLDLDALYNVVVAAEMPVDTAKADELHKSGQAGKSKRAGGKVEPVQVAA